jgi:hypothetical protein
MLGGRQTFMPRLAHVGGANGTSSRTSSHGTNPCPRVGAKRRIATVASPARAFSPVLGRAARFA